MAYRRAKVPAGSCVETPLLRNDVAELRRETRPGGQRQAAALPEGVRPPLGRLRLSSRPVDGLPNLSPREVRGSPAGLSLVTATSVANRHTGARGPGPVRQGTSK